MSSYRKPEIQNGLPKITKIKWICNIFQQTVVKKLCLFHHSLTTFQSILKNKEIKQIIVKPPVGFEPATHEFWGFVTPAHNRMRKDENAIKWRKKSKIKKYMSEVGFEPTPGEPDCDLNAAP